MQLEGKSGQKVEVSGIGELFVRSERWRAAIDRGDAYVFHAIDADVVAGDTMLALRNDSPTRKLVIERIVVINGNVATLYAIHLITAAFTAAGTAVAGVNMNGLSNKSAAALATAIHDETGNTQGAILQDVGAGVAVETYDVPGLVGLVLAPGTAIGIDQVTESTAGSASIYAYFEDIE